MQLAVFVMLIFDLLFLLSVSRLPYALPPRTAWRLQRCILH